jgi:hypothetical protein
MEDFAEGVETGKMQAISQTRQGFLHLVMGHFPDLEELAQAYVQQINSQEKLVNILVKINMARTEQEARELLIQEPEA